MYLISKEAVTQRCLDSTSGLIKEKSKCLELNDPLLAKNPQNIHTGQTKINSPKHSWLFSLYDVEEH